MLTLILQLFTLYSALYANHGVAWLYPSRTPYAVSLHHTVGQRLSSSHQPHAIKDILPTNYHYITSNFARTASGSSNIPEAPAAIKSRIEVKISGPTVNNALFRAELKKELTFFRGCSASYKKCDETHVELNAEGKTAQIVKFLHWLDTFSRDTSERKPSFQVEGSNCPKWE